MASVNGLPEPYARSAGDAPNGFELILRAIANGGVGTICAGETESLLAASKLTTDVTLGKAERARLEAVAYRRHRPDGSFAQNTDRDLPVLDPKVRAKLEAKAASGENYSIGLYRKQGNGAENADPQKPRADPKESAAKERAALEAAAADSFLPAAADSVEEIAFSDVNWWPRDEFRSNFEQKRPKLDQRSVSATGFPRHRPWIR